MLRKLNILLISNGLDLKKIFHSLRGSITYLNNLTKFSKMLIEKKSDFEIKTLYPCLSDRYEGAGSLPLHYFHLDRYVASRIYENAPVLHADIGSRIDGFVAQVSVFRKLEVFDIRQLNYPIQNVTFRQADLMSADFHLKDYCDSISCLHVIEHLGLGRYGDPLDPDGHIKAITNIHKMLKSGGIFYFAAPIGPLRIEYDAHRVFSIRYLLDLFEGLFKVEHFSYISDDNVLFTDVPLTSERIKDNFNCNYGCGIFELRKV